MDDIVIYGAGGLGRELLENIEEINEGNHFWRVLGFVDDGIRAGGSVCGHPLLGGFDFFRSYTRRAGVVIAFADCAAKEAAYEKIKALDSLFYFPILVNPRSYVSSRAVLGEGTVVARFCSVHVNARVGKCVLVSNKCEISHEDTIGDFVSLMPSVNISGNVIVGKRTLIGVQAAILQGLVIGGDSVVGMGSMVLSDIPDGCTVLGSPAKITARK